jgi:hypothetical protein
VKPLNAAGLILVALLAVFGVSATGAVGGQHTRTVALDTSWGGHRCIPQSPCHHPQQSA